MTTYLSSLKPISMVEEFPLFTVKNPSAQLCLVMSSGSGKNPSVRSLATLLPETIHSGGVVIENSEPQPCSPADPLIPSSPSGWV